MVSAVLSKFNGSRVLITGDTGFKGSWLKAWLVQLGAEVHGFSLPRQTEGLPFRMDGLDLLTPRTDGDINDLAALLKVASQFAPEFVFHLAARALVRGAYSDPQGTFAVNVLGSVNVLEMVRLTESVRSLVYVTSDKCYRNREWIWGYRENDELGGSDPYSASKAAAEMAFASYRDSYFGSRPELGAASVRAGNVIGGGDWSEDRIVPDVMRALRRERPVKVRNAAATRPWQHVLDPLHGYLRLALALADEPERFGGSWNFGPEAAAVHSVEDLVRLLVSVWGSGGVERDSSPDPRHESTLLRLSIEKAQSVLGWNPVLDFESAVRWTASWYRSVLDGIPAGDATNAQIAEYEALLGE